MITVPVNEVYTKASRELMKNSDLGTQAEQLGSLIREQTGRARGLTGTQGSSGLGQLLPQFLPGVTSALESGHACCCVSLAEGQRRQFDWDVGAIFLRLCLKGSHLHC